MGARTPRKQPMEALSQPLAHSQWEPSATRKRPMGALHSIYFFLSYRWTLFVGPNRRHLFLPLTCPRHSQWEAAPLATTNGSPDPSHIANGSSLLLATTNYFFLSYRWTLLVGPNRRHLFLPFTCSFHSWLFHSCNSFLCYRFCDVL